MKNLFLVAALVSLAGCGQRESSALLEKPLEPSKQAVSVNNVRAAQSKKLLAEGIKKLNDGQVAPALKDFNEAIVIDSNDEEAYLILGQTLMRLQSYDRAADAFSALVRIEPNNGKAHYLLAIANGLSGNKEAAKVNAQRSIELFQSQQDQEGFMRSLALMQGLQADSSDSN